MSKKKSLNLFMVHIKIEYVEIKWTFPKGDIFRIEKVE